MARRKKRTHPADTLVLLRTVNALSQSLRHGFDENAAQQIASTAQVVLGARSVAVTRDKRLVAVAGESVDWQASAERNARIVLDRRRTDKPTLYEATLGSEHVEVAISVINTDDLAIGTVHVIAPGGARLDMGQLAELTELASTQLQLAELDQSRAYAAESELRALRAQISPHFLNNALTAIAGLVNTDPVRARTLMTRFAGFLQASFREQTDSTTVSEELRLVEAYLELENARFDDRFAVSLDIAPEALPVKLPFLIVQPLVENAIRHGLEKRPGRGRLHIAARNAGPEISIEIEDDGIGIDPDLLERALRGEDADSHVGILSVDVRLRRTFGPEYGLTVETGKGLGTCVTVRLPKYAPGLT